jgi:hypothetical protein
MYVNDKLVFVKKKYVWISISDKNKSRVANFPHLKGS